MTQPQLTFFCELEPDALLVLFADGKVVDHLLALEASVSLGILDLTDRRARMVRRLNEAGIPVTAWQLLPKEQGYWFNAANAPQAAARYADFRRWTAEHNLRWDGVGLDIELDIHEMQRLAGGRWTVLPTLAGRILHGQRLRQAESLYTALVARIRADGHRVDSYVIPFIVDERQAGSTLLRCLAGLVDIPVDREVLMLYTSFFRPSGPGMLWSYGSEAASIAVGVTGGGVDVGGTVANRPLDWEEFSRDLLLARHWTENIHVFSLEGCVEQSFLSQLRDFDWGLPITPPLALATEIEKYRKALRVGLWASAHPWWVAGGALAAAWALRRLRRR